MKTPWLLICGVVALAVAFVSVAVVVSRNEGDIQNRPTNEQVLRVLAKEREADRRSCRVVEKRLGGIGEKLAGQRPSAATTEYYATRPEELAQAQRDFDAIRDLFRRRDCSKEYPVPTIEDVTGGGDGSAGNNSQPP